MHLKNQRKKVKEKKTQNKIKKPPMFDFSPLKSRGLRVLLVASASGALGVYAPIFYLVSENVSLLLNQQAFSCRCIKVTRKAWKTALWCCCKPS